MEQSKEQKYWNERYNQGGISGLPNRTDLGKINHQLIESFVDIYKVRIIDYGCGDLGFWKTYNLEDIDYHGIDISDVILRKNRKKYPKLNFYKTDQIKHLKGDVVLCFSVLFHILDDRLYVKILNDLAQISKNYIFIYTWYKNPFTRLISIFNLIKGMKFRRLRNLIKSSFKSDGVYQKYREFERFYNIMDGFSLIKMVKYNNFGATYVFKKHD